MSLVSKFKGWFAPQEDNVLHTAYGTYNLAKSSDRAALKRTVVEMQRQTDALTRKDLQDWRSAWQMAINVDNPNRARLYDLYRDVDVDLHLSGCVGQRTGFVLARSFKLEKADGTADEEAVKLFDAPWFKQFITQALSNIYWGYTLIELGDVIVNEDGKRMYTETKIIPRKHVLPEFGVVVRQVGEDAKTGVDYRADNLRDWYIEVGSADDLGLYLKAATQTIPKKNALGFWDTFSEIFGMPMRIAKTTTRDDKERAKMEKMMEGMGAALWAVVQEGTEIEVVENSRGDAYNVYDRRIDRANSELSKLILQQTMTIEDGSSLSQSQTHLEVFKNLIEQDCDMLRDIINNRLLPRMVLHGFPVQGLSFEWDYSVDYTPEQQIAYEQMVLNNYEVDGSYFEEKYGMPVGERRSGGFTPLDGGDNDGTNDKSKDKDKDADKDKKAKNQKLMQDYFARLSKEMEHKSADKIDARGLWLQTLQAQANTHKPFFD